MNMSWDIDYLNAFTRLTPEGRRRLEAYYGGLSEPEKIEVQKIQTDLYHQKSKPAEGQVGYVPEKKHEFNYGCHCLAIAHMRSLDPDLAGKKAVLDALTEEQRQLQFARRMERLKELKSARKAPKRASILRHYMEFEEMLAAGFSFADLVLEIHNRKTYKHAIGTVAESYLRDVILAERTRREHQKQILSKIKLPRN